MTDWRTPLRQGAYALGITLSQREEEQFSCLMTLLLERNAQINLTAITEVEAIAMKHFLDALTVETVWEVKPGQRAIDIGAGAGFPGLPLAIRHPKLAITLNDSVRKKVDFMREAASGLELKNVEAVWARAETLGRGPEHRGRYDIALARAVAHLGLLIEYALPLLKLGGRLIAMKGPGGMQEAAESRLALAQLGGEITAEHRLTLPAAGERILIVVRKSHPTPGAFPRDPGAARKKPLFLDSGKREA